MATWKIVRDFLGAVEVVGGTMFFFFPQAYMLGHHSLVKERNHLELELQPQVLRIHGKDLGSWGTFRDPQQSRHFWV